MQVVVGGCISSLTWERKEYLRQTIKELIYKMDFNGSCGNSVGSLGTRV